MENILVSSDQPITTPQPNKTSQSKTILQLEASSVVRPQLEPNLREQERKKGFITQRKSGSQVKNKSCCFISSLRVVMDSSLLIKIFFLAIAYPKIFFV